MKKTVIPFILALVALIFSCDNPYVQEILRDEALLKNIAVAAENGLGEKSDINYGLTPGFTPENLEYYAFVPKDSESITVTGVTNRDQTVSYSMNGGPPQANGTFPFSSVDPVTEKNSRVTLTVNRDYMDTVVYTVIVYRKQPSWLTGILVKTDVGGSAAYSLNPGFNASITDYSVGVSSAATSFRLQAVKRDYDAEGITVEYSGDGALEPEEAGYYSYTFPADMQEKTVTITASFPQEDPVPVVYEITIQRSRQVNAASGQEAYFAISGSSDHYFYQGEPVSFQVTPPFGYTIGSVAALQTNGDPVSLSAASTGSESIYGNTYNFIMPLDGVELTGTWNLIPASADTNVRYVREGGAPYRTSGTGDGDALSWATATNDLQAVIDDFVYDGAGFTGPVSQGNKSYEIWIARGDVSPNWAWVEGSSTPPGWASALIADKNKTKDNWCFVLKERVHIYGGFRGIEETQTDKTGRDIQQYETVLSGELPDFGNTRHLILAADISGPTLLDGLTVANSMAGGRAYNITINGVSFATGGGVVSPTCWTGAGIVTQGCNEDMVFSRLTIRNNSTMYGGGVYNYQSSPRFTGCTFRENSVFYHGGAIMNYKSSPVLEDCAIVANMASDYGGGIYGVDSGLSMTGGEIRANRGGGIYIASAPPSTTIKLTNVRISGNESVSSTGGVYIPHTVSSLVLTNMEISGNKSSVSSNPNGGLYTDASSSTLTNVTIAGNNGTGMSSTAGTIYINNTIIWGNGGYPVAITPTCTNSLIQGVSLGVSPFDGSTDPLFVSPRLASAAPAADGDYRLSTGSPCINAGNDSAYGAGVATDLAGNPRKMGTFIDLGAYEGGY